MPIKITIEAASAGEMRQYVHDLALIVPMIPDSEFPVDTHVAAPVTPPAAMPAPQPPQAPTAPAGTPYPPQYPTAAPYGQQAPSAPPGAPYPPAQTPAPTAPVPTSAPTYTIEQLGVAATALMEAGHNMSAILAEFGVPALTALPKEQYGAFATRIRALGAKI